MSSLPLVLRDEEVVGDHLDLLAVDEFGTANPVAAATVRKARTIAQGVVLVTDGGTIGAGPLDDLGNQVHRLKALGDSRPLLRAELATGDFGQSRGLA